MEIKPFVFNPFMENTYIIFDKDTREAAVIDPGCYEPREQKELAEFIHNNELNVKLLLNTHCHLDHIFGNRFVQEKYNVGLGIHKNDLEMLRAAKVYAPGYGFDNFQDAEPEYFIEEGQTIAIGDNVFEIIFIPGHSPGHVGFYSAENKILISGDVLFQDSIGRTDLPGGDYNLLLENIHNKVLQLADDVVVYSGHGQNTTIGHERKNNPFVGQSA
ncbi:MAG TPA: MBL fold metallo-hydrolase [Cyclobacteriaceae bacterium]